MAAVVWIHAFDWMGQSASHYSVTRVLQIVLIESCKFSTPAFFVISGFLLGSRLPTNESLAYFRRRWNRVGGPWAIWAGAYLVWLVLSRRNQHSSWFRDVAGEGLNVFFNSIYWFVPNVFVSLAVLLLCRRFVDRVWFGFFLFSTSLLFGLNVYVGWFSSSHTTAVGGYISYLWLGIWVFRHQERVERWVQSINWHVLILWTTFFWGTALLETVVLVQQRSESPLSTLRITNQVFSVLILVCMLKARIAAPRWANGRSETYGVYLIHPILLDAFRPLLCACHAWFLGESLIADGRVWRNPVFALVYWSVLFVGTYAGSLLITRFVVRLGLGRMVGSQ
jgi:surface polysaccharide O-acyltransferase-like enzyme